MYFQGVFSHFFFETKSKNATIQMSDENNWSSCLLNSLSPSYIHLVCLYMLSLECTRTNFITANKMVAIWISCVFLERIFWMINILNTIIIILRELHFTAACFSLNFLLFSFRDVYCYVLAIFLKVYLIWLSPHVRLEMASCLMQEVRK